MDQYDFCGLKRDECPYQINGDEKIRVLETELEVYKKALEMACNEIRDRECCYSRVSKSCKQYCELYDVCTNKIDFEKYYLHKVREEE